jgi:hypothetical protein
VNSKLDRIGGGPTGVAGLLSISNGLGPNRINGLKKLNPLKMQEHLEERMKVPQPPVDSQQALDNFLSPVDSESD